MLVLASKKMLEELTDTPVELGISSEWGYGMPLLSKKPLFVLLANQVKQQIAVRFLLKLTSWVFQV